MSVTKYCASPSDGGKREPQRSEWINWRGCLDLRVAVLGFWWRACLPSRQLSERGGMPEVKETLTAALFGGHGTQAMLFDVVQPSMPQLAHLDCTTQMGKRGSFMM